MSWLGLRFKGTEVFFSWEWNLAVLGLDILYARQNALEQRVDCLEDKVEQIYWFTAPPRRIYTFAVDVGTEPRPLTSVRLRSRRVHIRVPSTATTPVYIGDYQEQLWWLEPGEKHSFDTPPDRIYVRSLGNVRIYVAVEEVG